MDNEYNNGNSKDVNQSQEGKVDPQKAGKTRNSFAKKAFTLPLYILYKICGLLYDVSRDYETMDSICYLGVLLYCIFVCVSESRLWFIIVLPLYGLFHSVGAILAQWTIGAVTAFIRFLIRPAAKMWEREKRSDQGDFWQFNQNGNGSYYSSSETYSYHNSNNSKDEGWEKYRKENFKHRQESYYEEANGNTEDRSTNGNYSYNDSYYGGYQNGYNNTYGNSYNDSQSYNKQEQYQRNREPVIGIREALEILGFTSTSEITEESLKKHYHQKAKIYHSDNITGSDEKMKELNIAHTLLKNMYCSKKKAV